jgi:hypothetical protein
MAMLRPEDFLVATLKDSTGISLFLARHSYERSALVVRSSDHFVAVCLDKDPSSAFRSFECSGNDAWSGLLVPNISIEVDATKLCEPNVIEIPVGALIRHDDKLSIVTRHACGFGVPNIVPLYFGLQVSAPGLSAGFYKWTVGLGSGQDRRVLLDVDLSDKEDDT